jgi:hypothetical protein
MASFKDKCCRIVTDSPCFLPTPPLQLRSAVLTPIAEISGGSGGVPLVAVGFQKIINS